jgi:hypothetical protein
MKTCPSCKINQRDTSHSYCKECRKIKQREYNKTYRNTEHGKSKMQKLTRSWVRSKIGFTDEYFLEKIEDQKYLCAICGTDKPNPKNNRDWQADHDHVTGKPRGILCAGCNTLLGRIESVGFDWVDNAKKYLSEY